jgi:hypothetical protein
VLPALLLPSLVGISCAACLISALLCAANPPGWWSTCPVMLCRCASCAPTAPHPTSFKATAVRLVTVYKVVQACEFTMLPCCQIHAGSWTQHRLFQSASTSLHKKMNELYTQSGRYGCACHRVSQRVQITKCRCCPAKDQPSRLHREKSKIFEGVVATVVLQLSCMT